MLQKAGLKPDKIQRIDYSGRKTPEADSTIITDPQRKRLWAICKEHNVVENVLKGHLVDKYRITSTDQIKRGDYEAICAWAGRGGKEE